MSEETIFYSFRSRIAHLMNISLKGVEVARSRIRKKIGIPSTKSLTEFMIEFK